MSARDGKKPLSGRVAVVAGATRGAGRGIARMLGEAGAIVYCTGRSSRESSASGGAATKRPETIEAGSNILTGATSGTIVKAVALALAQPANWQAPAEYLAENVSQTVCKILLGYTSLRRHVS